MALFGGARDISLFRHLNRELLGDIITQQIAYYKFVLNKTKANIYGEAVDGKFFQEPVLLNCLINRSNQEAKADDMGIDISQLKSFYFLKDDLIDASLVPEIGDIIMEQESYFEVDTLISNQMFVGKDPNYPYSLNPLNPGLENFGSSWSILCECHLVPGDKVGITKKRM
jgi:hypothetical protein